VRELLWVASAAAQAELTVDEVRPMLPPCTGADVERRVAPALRRAVVLEMARQAGEVRTGQVAQALGMRVQDASRMLARMAELGVLERSGHGMYAPSSREVRANIKRGEVA
jgi:hypothetical protein